jgi:homoserine kinase
MNQITIRVPATSANLGPGYDCLGVALQLANRVTVARAETPPVQSDPMAAAVAAKFFAERKIEPFPFSWKIEGDVPASRGLGSSVTVRLGLLYGLAALAADGLGRRAAFYLCSELEGHPDNAAPATFGGFNVSRAGDDPIFCEVAPELRFVLLIPDFEVSTPEARKVLPAQLDRLGAVESCANACRITAAFCQRRYEMLRGAFGDQLHQPHRLALIPFLYRAIAAGVAAGALGGFLSGSGSTICCVTLRDEDAVAAAMLAAAPPGARTIITSADNAGARIES